MNNSARESILGSIRTHLATSAPFEDHPVNPANPVILSTTGSTPRALPELFKESAESVSGHCIITTDTTDAVKQLLTDLNAQRVATSDNQLQKKETSCANYFCYCSF